MEAEVHTGGGEHIEFEDENSSGEDKSLYLFLSQSQHPMIAIHTTYKPAHLPKYLPTHPSIYPRYQLTYLPFNQPTYQYLSSFFPYTYMHIYIYIYI